jgi:tRNA A37 methylthiotransferase MiaB
MLIIHEELYNHDEENKKEYKITYTLDEIRPLLIREIPTAHDPKGIFNLSNLKIFEHYHEMLDNYLKRFKKNKSTMSEKLAFICLLSYPEPKIREAKSFDCFKLFTYNENKDSDFEIIEIIDSEYNEQDEHTNEGYDCICSYQKLKKVFKVENIYSGITLYVGCECIKTYCIVSKKELTEKSKEMDEIRKKIKIEKKKLMKGYLWVIIKNKKIRKKN